MKLVMLLPELHVRGGIRRSLLLCQAFAEAGHEVTISCPGGPLLPWLLGEWTTRRADPRQGVKRGPDGRKPHVSPPMRADQPPFRFQYIPWQPGKSRSQGTRDLVGKLGEIGPDAIHVGSLVMPTSWSTVFRSVECVRVVTVHSAADAARIPRRQLSSFDTVIAVSNHVQTALVDLGRQPRAKIRHVASGAPALGGNGRPGIPEHPVIACVDPLVSAEGVVTLFEAGQQLRSRGVQASVMIAGHGPAAERVRAWIRTNRAGAWAMLTEAAADPVAILEADALVSCTGSLDGSQYALEAMGRGIPALMVNAEGNPELIRHGESGFLWDAGDAAGLARALGEALTDRETRTMLVREGMRAVREEFTVQRMVAGTMLAYQWGHGASESGRFRAVSASGRTAAAFGMPVSARKTAHGLPVDITRQGDGA